MAGTATFLKYSLGAGLSCQVKALRNVIQAAGTGYWRSAGIASQAMP
jgi:hypothetical protein